MKDYSFGNFICSLRKRRGLSQFQLGALVGVSNKAVSKWENGSAKPQIATCHKLAAVLQVSLDELLACKYNTSASAEKGIFAMKKKLWLQAHEKLISHYGEHPPVAILNRYESEKSAFHDSDLIVYISALSDIAAQVRQTGARISMRADIHSSFIAWLLEVTDVNPLPPHYYCPSCKSIEFHPEIEDGWDLPIKRCVCGQRMDRDGHRIPFESFVASQEKRNYFDFNVPRHLLPAMDGIIQNAFRDSARVVQLAMTDGHPASESSRFLIVSPDETRIPETENGILETTYEEYWTKYYEIPHITVISSAYEDTLYKLSQYTNRSIDRVEFLSPEVLSSYRKDGFASLVEYHKSISPLLKTLPSNCFSDLIRIEGLLHATGAWENNGELLIQANIIPPSEIIAVREDIFDAICTRMNTSSQPSGGTGLALRVMTDTFKGRYSLKGMPEMISSALREIGLPDWYIDCIKKIGYLFPKGHVISFLRTHLLLLWFYLNESEVFERLTADLHS